MKTISSEVIYWRIHTDTKNRVAQIFKQVLDRYE